MNITACPRFRCETNFHICTEDHITLTANKLILLLKIKNKNKIMVMKMWMGESEGPGRQTHCEERHRNYGYRRFHREGRSRVGFR